MKTDLNGGEKGRKIKMKETKKISRKEKFMKKEKISSRKT